jgi:NAD-dependent deacetylase
MSLPDDLSGLLDRGRDGLVVFLTGAGISAESGIPTFRGPEGYWQVGSRHYHPQEMATNAAFRAMPDEVWAWYLYRRSVCRAAAPNPAHHALAALEKARGDRFLLVTQNVDGLHLRAGNTLARTYQIHGNIDYMRCAAECVPHLFPVPEGVPVAFSKTDSLDDALRAALVCPECGGRARPHVLWFDEYYDEAWYRWESSVRAASTCSLLVVVGTSGSTNLPMRMGAIVAQRGAPMIVVNADENPFAEMARGGGYFAEGSAGVWVPEIVRALTS